MVGIFEDLDKAKAAADDLLKNGFEKTDVRVISQRLLDSAEETRSESEVPLPLLIGAAAGAAAALAVPAVAGRPALLQRTPGMLAFVGAAFGAAVGGMTWMVNLLRQEPRRPEVVFAEELKRGGTVVSVNTDEALSLLAANIMRAEGALDTDEWLGEQPGKGEPAMTDDVEQFPPRVPTGVRIYKGPFPRARM